MLKIIVLMGLFIAIIPIKAQDLSNFTALEPGGTIPNEFIELSTQKYEADLAENTDKEIDKDFFLTTRFFIDRLLLSGRILFNEPLSDYVNSVAKYTLRSEKGLYEELRFYVLKSTTANAFSTDQGIIIITTGLLAQLENEAQLAYIIAHEVSHYSEKHVRNRYIERQEMSRGSGRYKRLEEERKINELSIYDQSNEFEADEKGVDLFLRTEYSVNEIFTSFEMLLYSYLPFDEREFDPAFFEAPQMEIPDSYFPDTVKMVSRTEDYDDKNSTHPNISKRMDAVYSYLGDKQSRGKVKFKISESEFNKVQTLARFEELNILLANRRYGEALYNIYILRFEHPDNRFLDLSFVKALYGLTKYRNASRYREVVEKPKDIEGSSFPLHLFLYDLNREEINTIALRHAYDMSLKYPNDRYFELYFEDLKKELAINSRVAIDEYTNRSVDAIINEPAESQLTFNVQDSIDRIDASDLSKYQKIRLKNKLLAIGEETAAVKHFEDEDFYKFALTDLVQNGLENELVSIKRQERDEEEKPEADPVKKVVVVDPIYQDYNLKKSQNLQKSEERKIKVSQSYTKAHKNLNLEVAIVDSKNLSEEEVKEYFRMGVMFQWVIEVLEHDEIDMIASTHDQMDDITNAYGTDQFLFSGIYAYKQRNQANFNHLLWGMTIYGLPFVLADLLIVHNYFDMISFVVDASNDELRMNISYEVNLKALPKTIDAYVYDALYQVKNG